MHRLTRRFGDSGARERFHVIVTGLASLAVFCSLVFLAACTACPGKGTSCPRFPIPYDPR